MQKIIPVFLISFIIPLCILAQDHNISVLHADTHHLFRPFRIAVMIGHTSIPPTGNSEHVFIPSWGLDLEYWFSKKWGVGSHNDIEVESFMVEADYESSIEREYPLVTTIEVLYKPVGGLVLQMGPGYEIEKKKNYAVIRYGIEYEFELRGHWDVFPSVFYDTRLDGFDTFSIGFGVGKRF